MGTSLFNAIAAAAPTTTEEPGIAVVVITGLVLVFAILVLLMLIIKLQGVIFSSMDKNKKEPAAPAAPAAKPAPVKAAAPVAKAAPAPKVEAGIPAEVVAAIAAAVACMDGGRYTLRSVVRKREGRSAWNMAGVIASTDPF